MVGLILSVYNTLNLFADKGLLKQLALAEGRIVFDANVSDHHHFIDEDTGRLHDIPWDAISMSNVDQLRGYRVREDQVVLRGSRRSTRRG